MTQDEFFNMMGDGWRKFFKEHGIQYVDFRHGWSEKEQKWYGWSHRAIFGFGIGSKVSRGDCGYRADTPEGLIESRAEFWSDIGPERAQQARDECQILPDRSGIRVLHAPMMLPMADSMEAVVRAIEIGELPEPVMVGEDSVEVIKCGRGEWTAHTLEDAKQMALDFAEGVA